MKVCTTEEVDIDTNIARAARLNVTGALRAKGTSGGREQREGQILALIRRRTVYKAPSHI